MRQSPERKAMDKKDKLKKIENYEKMLISQCSDMDDKRKEIAKGICKVAAFAYIEALDIMDDILENGWVELFSQSEKTEPYERERPVSGIMLRLFEKYTKSISQLNNMLPAAAAAIKPDDSLLAFVASRKD